MDEMTLADYDPAWPAQFADRLLFRDYLRAHPEEAECYAALKHGLLARFSEDREAYTSGKTDYVYSIMQKAQADAKE